MRLSLYMLLVLFLASCGNSRPDKQFQLDEDILYKVIRIVDGDTYVLEDKNGTKEKIRIIGADTPETKHPRKGVEPFGPEATAFAVRHLSNKVVRLKFEQDKRDRYNRVLAHVFINKVHFNKMLIDSGFAETSFYSPNYKYQEQFEEAQKLAKTANLGLWSIK